MHKIDINLTTGETRVLGRDGLYYPADELFAAQDGAKRGDPEAQAKLDLLTHDEPSTPEQVLHDCPECRADREAGREPIVTWTRGIDPPLEPNWWHGRRSKRRRARHQRS